MSVPVQVWVDVDEGIAEAVRDLNRMFGVRTHASCDAKGHSYKPYVMVSWDDGAALDRIRVDYAVKVMGKQWGYARPRNAQSSVTPSGYTDTKSPNGDKS